MASPVSPSWGVELWDQYDKIASHTQNGVQFLDNFHAFIKERSAVEAEYADKLRKMAKKYQPKKARQQGHTEDEDTSFTTHVAFDMMLNEISDLAGQHEVISEDLIQKVSREIASLVRELKDERKRLLGEGSKLQQNLQNCITQMDKCQRAYSKAHKEAEKAQEKYERAEKDMHLSRAEVEIAKQSSIAKNQNCEETKAEYAAQLQKTNELQRMHFNENMPRVFSDLQQMDERRITCIRNFMKQVAQSQLDIVPIVNNCLNGIISAAEKVDAVKDSEMVVDKYKSGFFPPDDFPFENLSEEKPNGSTSLNYSASSGHRDRSTMRGTVSGKSKKRGLLAGIFGPSNKNNVEDAKEETWADLPPNQRRKKIQKKLKDIREELAHENNQKDGLHKMRRTYEENPALGDAALLEPENERIIKRLENLHQQVQKYQSLLNEIESSTPDAVKRHSGHTRGNSIISEDTGSLSRSNSDESNIHSNNSGTQRLKALPRTSNGSCNGVGTHGLSRDNSSSSSTNSPSLTPMTPTTPSTPSGLSGVHNGTTNSSNGASGPISPISIAGNHNIPPIDEEEGTKVEKNIIGDNESDLSSHVYATIAGGPIYATSNGGDRGVHNSESGVGSGSLRDIDDPEFEEHNDEDEPLPPLGTAVALYAFEAQNEGAISMNENDDMYIVELDQGDGWTRVRMVRDGEEGFVPSSYLDITMYNTC